MYIQPIGIAASNLSVFWPLWDAALLRRYGRARACPWPPSMAFVAAYLALSRSALGQAQLQAMPPSGTTGRTTEEPERAQAQPPELDLYWPSDAPLEPPQIIVVERWMREQPSQPGDLLDLLY